MMKAKGLIALINLINDITILSAKNYKGDVLIEKMDKLMKKTFKKIKNNEVKKDLKKVYDKFSNEYLRKYGYDDLKLIKGEKLNEA